MQKRTGAIQRIQHRPGEGHSVDFTVTAASVDGVAGSIDMSSVPVPERKFACDLVGIQAAADQARLLFAQRQPVGDELMSMLVINMSPDSVVQLIGALPEAFMNGLRTVADGAPSSKLTDFKTNAPQSIVLNGSMLMAGYTGRSGCIDIYYASPFAVQQLAALQKLSLEAVVRVNLTTGSLFALLDGLQNIAREYNWLKSDE